MAENLRIAVCGAGIGGLASALLLSRAGHDVTLFERFETPEPVGSGFMLQPTGMAVLHALGLATAIEECGARIDRLLGRSRPTDAIVLDVRYNALDPAFSGLAVQRTALFDLLYEAVKSEPVTVRSGMSITANDGASLHFEGHPPAGPFDLIIDSLGVRSVLSAATPARELEYGALWASLDWPDAGPFDPTLLEQRYFRASQMAGVMPIGTAEPGAPRKAAFFWSLHRDAFQAWRNTSLDTWKSQVRDLWPATGTLLDQITDHDALTFAAYRHRTLRKPYAGPLIHIGDSYHATSPQLGQGANMALLDAFALTRAIEAEGLAEIGPHYAQLRQGHVHLFQMMSRLFTPVYQSDSRALPILRDRIVGPLSGIQPAPRILGSLVTGLLGRPLQRLGLEPYRH